MLSEAHKKLALAHLNEICPDTFDEGEFGPWTFTDLRRKDNEWSLGFDNAEGSDGISFTYEGDCVDESDIVVDAWFEMINEAIIEWESGLQDY